jgi:hypothetical protein
MSSMNKAVIILGVSLILLAGAEAVADDPVMIRIYNDDAESIDLSVYDLNARPPDAAIVNQRVDGFAWIPISVTAGAVGKGHVKWIARTVDPSFRRCGSQEVRGVANDSLVYVSADSSCR